MAAWVAHSAPRFKALSGWAARTGQSMWSLRWLGFSLITGAALACGALGQKPAPTGTTQPDEPSQPGRAWATFVRDDCEWSDPRPSAACFGNRGAGFRVRAVRAEGTRWYVWDPSTDNYAYVDRDALSLPAELTAEQGHSSPPSMAAVVCLDRSKNFRYLGEAQTALAAWIKASARPGNTYFLRWIEDNSYRPEAEIVPAIRVAAQPTPVSLPATPGPANPFSTAQVAAATATVGAIQTVAARSEATRQAILTAADNSLNSQLNAFAQSDPGRADSGDVSGCVKKTSELLMGFDDDRYLLVASAANDGAPQVSGLKLDRVQVRVVYLQCDQPAECDAVKQQWAEVAAAANAADIQFSDPSEALSKLET